MVLRVFRPMLWPFAAEVEQRWLEVWMHSDLTQRLFYMGYIYGSRIEIPTHAHEGISMIRMCVVIFFVGRVMRSICTKASCDILCIFTFNIMSVDVILSDMVQRTCAGLLSAESSHIFIRSSG